MKKLLLAAALSCLIGFSSAVHAFADQGMNNAREEDAAAECDRDKDCSKRMEAIMKANPPSDKSAWDYIFVIILIVFLIKFFGSDRNKPK